MSTFLEGKTLAEKQMHYYNASKCIYCNNYTDLVDSIEVYQESHGLIYICRGCQAWVGVHHQNTDQSFGTVAKKALRDLRHETHKWFDPLWEKKVSQGVSKKTARAKAYAWAAQILNIDPVESHIGYWGEEQCKKIIEECKKFYLTPEQKEERRRAIEATRLFVLATAEENNFKVHEFKLNTYHRLELTHHSGKIFVYDLNNKTGSWLGKKGKPQPVNISEVLTINFNKDVPQHNKSGRGSTKKRKRADVEASGSDHGSVQGESEAEDRTNTDA